MFVHINQIPFSKCSQDGIIKPSTFNTGIRKIIDRLLETLKKIDRKLKNC